MLEGFKPIEAFRTLAQIGLLLLRQRLPGKVGQHLAGGAVLAASAFLHREQYVVVQRQRGAHASDASASGCQPINTANRGLITSSMIARRSSKWMNADFIALTVNRSRSLQP